MLEDREEVRENKEGCEIGRVGVREESWGDVDEKFRNESSIKR